MANIQGKIRVASEVPTPPVGYITLFTDALTMRPMYKDSTGAVYSYIGPSGLNGWTPVLAIVSDGNRRVQQVSDWTGGSGTKPAIGLYVGTSGFVADIANAVDIRGASGAVTPGEMKRTTAAPYSAPGALAWSTIGLDTAVHTFGTGVSYDIPNKRFSVSSTAGQAVNMFGIFSFAAAAGVNSGTQRSIRAVTRHPTTLVATELVGSTTQFPASPQIAQDVPFAISGVLPAGHFLEIQVSHNNSAPVTGAANLNVVGFVTVALAAATGLLSINGDTGPNVILSFADFDYIPAALPNWPGGFDPGNAAQALDALSAKLRATSTVNFAANADATLSAAQSNAARIVMTDAGSLLTGTVNVIIEARNNRFQFVNQTARNLLVKTPTGTGVTILSNAVADLSCDGTNVVFGSGDIQSVGSATLINRFGGQVGVGGAVNAGGSLFQINGELVVGAGITAAAPANGIAAQGEITTQAGLNSSRRLFIRGSGLEDVLDLGVGATQFCRLSRFGSLVLNGSASSLYVNYPGEFPLGGFTWRNAIAPLGNSGNLYLRGQGHINLAPAFGWGSATTVSGLAYHDALFFSGRVSIGHADFSTFPAAFVDVAASTASVPAVRIRPGAEYTGTASGSLYDNGTNLKRRGTSVARSILEARTQDIATEDVLQARTVSVVIDGTSVKLLAAA